MTWATPALGAILAAALIPPLVLLYFLKLRRQERPVPSTLLWFQAVADLQANAPFQKLKPNLLLFLQLLALIALLLAVAQPEWTGGIARSSRTVILIDRSASMAATDVEPSRLEEAKSLAVEYVRGMEEGGVFFNSGGGEQIMVIAFADEAQIVSGFSGSREQLIRSIEGITQSDGSSRIGDALELAAAYTQNPDVEGPGRPVGELATILLFSDGRIADISTQVTNSPARYRPVGAADRPGNLGIVATAARRTYDDQQEISIYVGLANYRTEPVTASVLLSAGDQLLKSTRVTIDPARAPEVYEPAPEPPEGDEDTAERTPEAPMPTPRLLPGQNGVVFSLTEARGITLGVELDVEDDFLTDNRAYVVVPPARTLRVALVSGAELFSIRRALAGIALISQVEEWTAEQFARHAADGTTDQYDLIVLESVNVETLGPGRYFILGPLPASLATVSRVEGEVRANVPVAWEAQHPVNRYVDYFSDILMYDYLPVTASDRATVLVEGSEGPLLIETTEPGSHIILAPFDLERSTLRLSHYLVILTQNVVQYLGSLGEAVALESLRPGEALSTRLPREATDIRLQIPGGDSVALVPADPTLTVWGPLQRTGIYTLSWSEPGADDRRERQFACNLFDVKESDIAPESTLVIGSDLAGQISQDAGLQKWPLWPWAVGFCLLVLMTEWWVYTRRAYI